MLSRLIRAILAGNRVDLFIYPLFFFFIFVSGATVSTADSNKEQHVNRLIHEKSPYLLQHAHNPVNWYPWCEEAFEKARREDKPIFLSIGYATCHWCHVMEKESFEDEEIANLLNRYFVSIKVDREERPDIDQVYMNVCQAMTGSGGWPLSVFMTPDAKPFFAGTYFPKVARRGMIGFRDVIVRIGELWKKDRDKILSASDKIVSALEPGDKNEVPGEGVGLDVLKKAYGHMSTAFDARWGGFSYPPKFPTPHNYTFLLRWHKRTGDPDALKMVEKTLKAMKNGGIFDQVGFGFHRYSVDEKWLVPHFEKMLYDQALLSIAYLDAYLVTLDNEYEEVAKKIFEYVLRDMTSPEGGFYTAEDADSEGAEGKFYVWTPEEVTSVLGKKDGELFCRYYGISERGNFEGGTSIPHVRMSAEKLAKEMKIPVGKLTAKLESCRQRLFEAREKRVHPLKDDKILTSWNGLMIAALAKGHRVTGKKSYIDAAEKCCRFILTKMTRDRNRLYRRYRNGHVAIPGYLDDYAFFVWGLIELYETTFDVSYLEKAIVFTDTMIELFWDREAGGFFYSGKDNEKLIMKTKEVYDGAIPSGNSVAAMDMMLLARITGNVEFENRVEKLLKFFSADISPYPMGYTFLLGVVDFAVGPAREIVLVGNSQTGSCEEMIRTIYRRYLPNTVIVFKDMQKSSDRLLKLVPYTKEMEATEGKCTAFVCEKFACKVPVTNVHDLENELM